MSEQIEKLSHIEHILKRPDSYVGPTSKTCEPYWVLDGTKFVQKSLTYSPALLKIFDEILVNAIDRNSMYPNEVKSISVLFDPVSGLVSIENSGPLGGISVKQHPTEKIWNPELTFGHLLTSTNYNDVQKRTVAHDGVPPGKNYQIFQKNIKCEHMLFSRLGFVWRSTRKYRFFQNS